MITLTLIRDGKERTYVGPRLTVTGERLNEGFGLEFRTGTIFALRPSDASDTATIEVSRPPVRMSDGGLLTAGQPFAMPAEGRIMVQDIVFGFRVSVTR